ncbi:MAG: N-acetylmuramoyl-L-alanine amidase [Clostridia bacterium]|nr:N-acetylmuramoyl-L-alanine amidase [Lachnospiraceae bacterium]NCC01868.1 N-acetylmuramoyl-L-alanine amidase [Clostridia bacterium]NCD02436.1 N-acetylmuramoyl-L-alanine amidase [Clostridia bacterium]
MKRILAVMVLMGLLGLSVLFYSRTYSRVADAVMAGTGGPVKKTVVIDPGHGGNDPGGIGVSGVLEKDVNLSVALFLKANLEQQGYEVVLTRDRDKGLYSESAVNKKKEDLAERIRIIAEAKPDFVICIHQNIFTDSKYSGAQVFYYKDSEEGARLASCIQNQLIAGVDPSNTRVPKSNMNYYMLKKSPSPIVIVECGFLTNAEEEAKLGTVEYQRKLAWNIYLGIMQYRNTDEGVEK